MNSISIALIATSLAFMTSGCLKSRSALQKENDNPDSGYATKVVEVSNPQQSVVDQLRGEINQLNGRIDELQRKNEALTEDQSKKTERDNQLRDLEAKVQELQASQAALIDALQKRQQEREKAKEVPKAEPTDAFESGRTAFRAKKYDEAIASFTQYLKFPKAKNAAQAYFLRGEAYFAKGDHKKAIMDYSALQEKFPKSKNVPKALFKIGSSFEALGMKAEAKAFYQDIVDKHPKSPEAKTAKNKLK